MSKPTLDDLLKKTEEVDEPAEQEVIPKEEPESRRIRNHTHSDSTNIDVEIIRVFCAHLIACGFDRTRAIELTFKRDMSKNQIRGMGQRLVTHGAFTEVMAAEVEKIEERLSSSERYVLDRLYRQSEANIMDYFDADENGVLKVKDLSNLDKWQQQNIKKLKVKTTRRDIGLERYIVEQEIEIEITDSFRAVALLGKNMGMFVERVEIDFGKHTANRLEEALERVRQKRLGHGHQQPEDQSRASGSVSQPG